MEKQYLVTGAAGFLGSNIVRTLRARGEKVRALILPGDPNRVHLPEDVQCFQGDTTDIKSLDAFFDVPRNCRSIVIHAAAIVSIQEHFDKRVYDVNVNGTRNVVKQALEHGADKLVYVSSVHAIDPGRKGQMIEEPDSFDPALVVGCYAKTKAEATAHVLQTARQTGLDASVVFPSGLCGPGDFAGGYVTRLFIDAAREKLPAGVKGGYDFADVRDVADGVIAAAERGGSGQGYILANRYVSVAEILHGVHELTGAKLVRHILPMTAAKAFTPLMYAYCMLTGQPALFTSYSLYTLQSNANFSTDKARRELGYTTRPFHDTMRDALNWLRSTGKIG